MQTQPVLFSDLGLRGYRSAWQLQEKLLQENLSIKAAARSLPTPVNVMDVATKHYLLFVEHPPVYTLGKSGKKENVLLTKTQLEENGIEFFDTNRGGDITFHGPEQIV
ncbi:MAG: hypothetical protein V4676_02975, partial [Bacteroidota bacterium]